MNKLFFALVVFLIANTVLATDYYIILTQKKGDVDDNGAAVWRKAGSWDTQLEVQGLKKTKQVVEETRASMDDGSYSQIQILSDIKPIEWNGGPPPENLIVKDQMPGADRTTANKSAAILEQKRQLIRKEQAAINPLIAELMAESKKLAAATAEYKSMSDAGKRQRYPSLKPWRDSVYNKLVAMNKRITDLNLRSQAVGVVWANAPNAPK